jgi:Rha family phage regulatory protein
MIHHNNDSVFQFDAMIASAPSETAVAIPASSAVHTMSSLKIAEITGKRHDNVIADIKRIFAEAEIDALGFKGISKDAYNRDQPCYHLPRRECDLVITAKGITHLAAQFAITRP